MNVIGKSGTTTVVASFRTDDKVASARAKASNLHQFYITTKVGQNCKDSTNYTNAYIKVNTFVKKHK
jgi:hypothetical protein